MEPVQLDLPYPPSVNRYWRHVIVRGQSRTLKSRAAKDYTAEVQRAVLLSQCPRFGISRLSVEITMRPPDLRKNGLVQVKISTIEG